MGSILVYSVFTAACGLTQTVWQLGACRFLLGLGMGGEWTTGAALVSETWPDRHRGKALGFMHSFWAVGYAAAAIMVAVVLPVFGWRAVFLVGVAPAILVLWVRRNVDESELWISSRTAHVRKRTKLRDIFRGHLGPATVLLTLLSLFTLFSYWGLNFWVPAYLSLPVVQGGLGLGTSVTTQLVLAMQVGTWLGLVSFGYVCDAIGRRKSYVIYLLIGAALVVLYGRTQNPLSLLVLGPFVALFGTGHLSGFGTVSAEVYPTSVRAAAQGFTFNVGRIGSAFAPFLAGSLAQAKGFEAAFVLTGAGLLLGALTWVWLPETRGRSLS
jgi:MFS family permease